MEKQAVKKIHVIYKTHLDIGFTDLSSNVFAIYENRFIPKAIQTARAVNADGQKRFIWTVGSYLIDRYLERAGEAQRRELEDAIRRGWIRWHALPFTTHTELMDASLFRYGLSISRRLDERFGVRTTAAKMSDVPGHTIGVVPLLAEAGVEFFHIGVNGSSKVPDVPQVFRWRRGESEVVVNYARSYGESTVVEGVDEAMVFMHASDNDGPPAADEVLAFLDRLQGLYPEAELSASTLDAFGKVLWNARERLPIVTEEIGDTWIHGAATDPRKTARFRALLALRERWEAEHPAGYDAARNALSKSLLLVPEHTWGMDSKKYLYDYKNWSKEAFRAARMRDAIPEEALLPAPAEVREMARREAIKFSGGMNGSYSLFERSHAEQRKYIQDALDALPDALRAEAEAAFAKRERQIDGSEQPGDGKTVKAGDAVSIGRIACRLNEDGSISLANGMTVGIFRYETYDVATADACYRHYNRNIPETFGWSYPDFAKPGLPESASISKTWTPVLDGAELSGGVLALRLRMDPEACETYGCPRRLAIRYEEANGRLRARLSWGQKDAVRTPEALWFGVLPADGVRMSDVEVKKLGAWISPLAIVPGGNHSLHAAEALRFSDFLLSSPDTPVISVGGRRLYDVSNDTGEGAKGFWLLPWNNRWGTNFRLWYEEDGGAELIVAPANPSARF